LNDLTHHAGQPLTSGASAAHAPGRLALGPLVLCLAAILVPLLATPVAPSIDFYNHVVRYWVMSHIGEVSGLADSYSVSWKLVPNMGLDAIGVLLLRVLDPLLAAKVLMAGVLLVQFTGSLALNRALNGRVSTFAALLSCYLLYSYILNWGFANFLLATGLSYFAMAAWLRFRGQTPWLIGLGVPAGLAIFLCHGFAFMVYGLTAAALEFGRWRRAGEPLSELVKGWVFLGLQAVLPALMFVVSPTSGGNALPSGQQLASSPLVERLGAEIVYRLTTIVRVAESPYAALDIASFVILVGLFAWGLRARVLRINPIVVPALGVLALLSVVTPPAVFGVGFVADRLPYLLALLIAAASALAPGAERRAIFVAIVAGLLAVRTAALAIGWSEYRRDWDDYRSVVASVPPGAMLTAVNTSPVYRGFGEARRCQMYAPLALPYFGVKTPLFADPRQQPLALEGKLKDAVVVDTQMPHWSKVRTVDDHVRAANRIIAGGRFDYILACDRSILADPQLRARAVAQGERFVILKAR
jgi:hypothetical protein